MSVFLGKRSNKILMAKRRLIALFAFTIRARVIFFVFFTAACSYETLATKEYADKLSHEREIEWITTFAVRMAVREGDCPSGMALRLYGEVQPDLSWLLSRLVQHGQTAIHAGN